MCEANGGQRNMKILKRFKLSFTQDSANTLHVTETHVRCGFRKCGAKVDTNPYLSHDFEKRNGTLQRLPCDVSIPHRYSDAAHISGTYKDFSCTRTQYERLEKTFFDFGHCMCEQLCCRHSMCTCKLDACSVSIP